MLAAVARRPRRRPRPRGGDRQPPAADLDRPARSSRAAALHDPRKRQCTLASLTSFTYEGDDLVSVSYAEPAARPAAGAGGRRRQEVRRRGLMTTRHRWPAARSQAAALWRRTGGRAAADRLLGGSSAANVADQGYVAGDGTVDPARRRPSARRPVAVRRQHARRQGARPRGPPRATSSSSTSGARGARRASPRRPPCRRCTSRLRRQGVQLRRHQHPRPDRAAARAHERRFGVTYPSLAPGRRAHLLAFAGTLPPTAIPIDAGARPQGPGRRPGDRRGATPARCTALVDDAVG